MIFSFQNASFRDTDTGLYNQAYFMEIFNREWHRLIRDNSSLSVILFNPHIKPLTPTDTQMLAKVGQILTEQTLRSTDITCRFDQTNFAMGLFGLDSCGTEVILERIRQSFNDNEINGALHCHLSMGGVHVKPRVTINPSDVFQHMVGTLKRAEKQANQDYLLETYSLH